MPSPALSHRSDSVWPVAIIGAGKIGRSLAAMLTARCSQTSFPEIVLHLCVM